MTILINACVFTALAVTVFLHGSIANAADLTGTVDNVVDGDTLHRSILPAYQDLWN